MIYKYNCKAKYKISYNRISVIIFVNKVYDETIVFYKK